ncbi:MAG: vitamin K epoxide reductase family protein [Candidatus Pacebacteria bacterium]|nr:vitamin K epoxide reductase family protein [Candidatus Paceibacterota bacterium]
MKRIGVAFILILAFFGLADSIYLTQSELSGAPLICNIQDLSGCNVVATSQYSHIFGIPLAEFGVLFYAVIFILAALELVIFDQILRRALQAFALVGLIASLYFSLVQIFFIGAFCIYCAASAIIELLIFIFASLIEPIRLNMRHASPAASPPAPGPHLRMPPSA